MKKYTVSTVAPQQEGSWFESCQGPFCVEFAWVFLSSLQPPPIQNHVHQFTW